MDCARSLFRHFRGAVVVQLRSCFNSLWPYGLQYARLPCSPLSRRICPNICPLSWWCYLTISSSAGPFTFCLPSFPASGSFPTSGLFVSGSQSIGVLASARVLPMNIQDWFPLGSAGLISLLSVHTNCTQIKKLRYGLQRDYAEITLKDLRIRGWRGSR